MADSEMPIDPAAAFPGPGEVIFSGTPGPKAVARQLSTGQARYDYTMGYKEAADLLVAQVETTGRRADKLGYPIVSLYRHHLELVVKSLIRVCCHLLGRDQDFPKHHRLDELWQMCAGLLRELSPGASGGNLQKITRLFHEFRALDPNADAFRFPEDTSGNAALASRIDINLSEVRDIVEKMAFFLDCIDTSIRAERDAF
jgi:hypothetical protein